MKSYRKTDFPTSKIRRFLEPGPIVLVSSAWKGQANIMTMGWHMVMEFSPSLVSCVISAANHSFELIRRSRECAINIPTEDLAEQVVGIGNCSGAEVNKFEKFKLTPFTGAAVRAPLIAECFANLECKLFDAKLVNKYNVFILEVVSARAATSPRYPRTLHYYGDGIFRVPGKTLNLRRRFKPEML